jgi:hypothetical protein
MEIGDLWDQMLTADETWVRALEKNPQVIVEEIPRIKLPDLKLVLYSDPVVFYEKNSFEKLEDLIKKHHEYVVAFNDLKLISKRAKKPIPKLSKLPLILDTIGRKIEISYEIRSTKKAKSIYLYKTAAYSNLPLENGIYLFKNEFEKESQNFDQNASKILNDIEREIRSDRDHFLIRRKSGTSIKIRPDWISSQITVPHILCLQADIENYSILKPKSFRKDKYKIVYQTLNYEVVREITD